MANISNGLVRFISNLWNGAGRRKVGDTWFYEQLNSKEVWAGINPLLSFIEVPEVNAVISKRAKMFSNGIPNVVNRNGKPVNKDEFLQRIKNPNWYQSFEEFVMNTRLHRDIYGEEIIYLNYPVGFPAEDFKMMYCLQPDKVDIDFKTDKPFFQFTDFPKDLVKVTYEDGNIKAKLDWNTIVTITDNALGNSQEKLLRGKSKLESLTPNINNIRMAYESRGVILKYRGAIGILSNDSQDIAGSVPIDPKEKDAIQNSFKKYGTLKGQHQVIITDAKVKWQSMMVNNPKNLGLFEEVEADFDRILDAFNMPTELFSGKDRTYENQNQARKSVYENAIIPEAGEWCAALNRRFFPDTPHKFILEYFHLPIFQEDTKHKVEKLQTAVNALTVLLSDQQITSQEYREELAKLGVGNGSALPVATEDNNDAERNAKAQAELRGTVGGVNAITTIVQQVNQGQMRYTEGRAILINMFGYTPEQAASMIEERTETNNSLNPNQNE